VTTDLFLEHADLVLYGLVTAMLFFPWARFIRLLVALFAGVELAHILLSRGDQTTLIWMSILLGSALFLMLFDILSSRRVRMTDEERAMASSALKRTGRATARHFIDQGFWLNGKKGDVLMREGEPVKHLYYLALGEARVLLSGEQVGYCRAGDLIADLPLFSRDEAIATIVLDGPARFWCAPADRIRPYLEVHTKLRRVLERSAAEDIKERDLPGDGAPLQTGEPLTA
jgi:hypothetical protein